MANLNSSLSAGDTRIDLPLYLISMRSRDNAGLDNGFLVSSTDVISDKGMDQEKGPLLIRSRSFETTYLVDANSQTTKPREAINMLIEITQSSLFAVVNTANKLIMKDSANTASNQASIFDLNILLLLLLLLLVFIYCSAIHAFYQSFKWPEWKTEKQKYDEGHLFSFGLGFYI